MTHFACIIDSIKMSAHSCSSEMSHHPHPPHTLQLPRSSLLLFETSVIFAGVFWISLRRSRNSSYQTRVLLWFRKTEVLLPLQKRNRVHITICNIKMHVIYSLTMHSHKDIGVVDVGEDRGRHRYCSAKRALPGGF